jgi:hypothetical protein
VPEQVSEEAVKLTVTERAVERYLGPNRYQALQATLCKRWEEEVRERMRAAIQRTYPMERTWKGRYLAALDAVFPPENKGGERSAFQCAGCTRDFEAEGHDTLPIDWASDGSVICCPDCDPPQEIGGEERCSLCNDAGWIAQDVEHCDQDGEYIGGETIQVSCPACQPQEQGGAGE